MSLEGDHSSRSKPLHLGVSQEIIGYRSNCQIFLTQSMNLLSMMFEDTCLKMSEEVPGVGHGAEQRPIHVP